MNNNEPAIVGSAGCMVGLAASKAIGWASIAPDKLNPWLQTVVLVLAIIGGVIGIWKSLNRSSGS